MTTFFNCLHFNVFSVNLCVINQVDGNSSKEAEEEAQDYIQKHQFIRNWRDKTVSFQLAHFVFQTAKLYQISLEKLSAY